MKYLLVFASASALALASALVSAQTLPACRATARVCNDVAGLNRHASDRFVDVPVSQAAAALPQCSAADQPSVPDCDAVLRRHNRSGRIVTVTVPNGGGVLALDPNPVPPRAPSTRDGTARRGLQELRPIAVTAYNNTLVLDGNIQRVDAASQARDLQLFRNQQDLVRGQVATSQRVDNVTWQVGDLREEFRVRFLTPIRYSWQSGGSPTFGAAGLGIGITRWGQGSLLGVDAHLAFHGYEYQPLVPGRTPLFGASASVHMVIGRGFLQGLVGAEGGMAFRFGDAGPGEATGGTAFDLGLGGGLRGEMPFYPVSRPQGARFFGQVTAHFGFGGSNAVVAGQDPLHLGFALSVNGMLGIAL